MGSCERAASAADLIRAARDKHAAHTRNSIRQVVTTAGGGNHTPPPPHITTTNTTSSSSGSGSGSLPRTWFSEGGALNPQERGFSASGFGSRLQPAGVSAGQHMVAQAGGSELKDVPFESLVLEVLLDATAGELVGPRGGGGAMGGYGPGGPGGPGGVLGLRGVHDWSNQATCK